MPRYIVSHTYLATVHIPIDAPSVPDAKSMVDSEVPKAWFPDKLPKDAKVESHHIRYDVKVVTTAMGVDNGFSSED